MPKEDFGMSDLFWLSDKQFARIEPHLPSDVRGVPRVCDRRVLSGIIHVIRRGLRWSECPPEYGPSKTVYNRYVRWSERGIFTRIFAALVAEEAPPGRLMIDSTHLKVHRTASSGRKKGGSAAA
jgi:transposase